MVQSALCSLCSYISQRKIKKIQQQFTLGKNTNSVDFLNMNRRKRNRFNWGFYWFTGLLTLSICRDAVDVIWVEITFGSRCAMRKCWVACKKCTAEEQLAVVAYRRAAKTPKTLGYEPNIINTPKQFPACKRPKNILNVITECTDKGANCQSAGCRKNTSTSSSLRVQHSEMCLQAAAVIRDSFTDTLCDHRRKMWGTWIPSERSPRLFQMSKTASPSRRAQVWQREEEPLWGRNHSGYLKCV